MLGVSAESVYCGATCQTETRLGDKQDLLLKQDEDFQGAAEVCNRLRVSLRKGNSRNSPRRCNWQRGIVVRSIRDRGRSLVVLLIVSGCGVVVFVVVVVEEEERRITDW